MCRHEWRRYMSRFLFSSSPLAKTLATSPCKLLSTLANKTKTLLIPNVYTLFCITRLTLSSKPQ
jgi:hypothetical protein